MSGCLSSSMTGSTDAGLLQSQEDPALPTVPQLSLTLDLKPRISEVGNDQSSQRGNRRCHQARGRRMTSAPPSGQTIQLTPLWEHVVRTHRFPSEVDTQATFVEISERLRDPEWEVRQHALRVLMDVIPTLNVNVVDKIMQPVIPELINNLGHPAPAVRKGALDTLRVYLVHSPDRDSMILYDGLNRPDAHNPFQTNVTTGVILNAPLLLFPSSGSSPPTTQVLKDATIAFASRLVQIPHQEAVLKSLMKIRDAVGEKEFESYLADYDDKLKNNIDVLSKIYNIKPSKKERSEEHAKEHTFDKSWDSDSDTSGIVEEEDESPNGAKNGAIPPARIVLETEIKFNEETAITMTILEEKGEDDSDDDEKRDKVADNDTRNDVVMNIIYDDPSFSDKRKTPRRVHFGGEIVKLRTPDSDETESIEITPKTRIPLPVSPVTKMPETTKRRPSSQPCSPYAEKRGTKRASRSASSSPKREYTHNAQLSPKKSILARTIDDSLIVVNSATEGIKNVKKDRRSDKVILNDKSYPVNGSSQQVNGRSKREEITLISLSANNEESSLRNNENNRAKDEIDVSKLTQVINIETSSRNTILEQVIHERNHEIVIDKNDTFDITAKREKNYPLLKLSSPERNKVSNEDRDDILKQEEICLYNEKSSENYFPHESNSFLFGSPVNEYNTPTDGLVGDNFINDNVQDAHTFGLIANDRAVTIVKYDNSEVSVRNSNGEGRKRRDQYDRKSGLEGNGSVTCSSSEGESKPQEPSWEELGLVDQEVLDDLHNKDDWRARVRGLERVASALRTSSALIAIESRLGSLLHTVLGGERSCRVAAAGLAVAKIVVAGVSEDALRKILPQLAWGLARQGGPAAAQLTKIAMIRLKPSLLMEQLLQPHCLSARNTKTRENTLQLLIFSLVTFPSTEFELIIVSNRVATMVADRRRRVRQAALDTLAVLGQIYDSEEVLNAGRRATEGSADAEAILAAIRARLARKSLPLVSADGLVVYGLQISPAVQIATGPDVDWIVAGSGSVSPGTGRTRGQIIATSRSAQGRISRNESTNNRESPWIERPNFVTLGVGLQSKIESTAWQILSSQSNDASENEIKDPNGRSVTDETGVSSHVNLTFEKQLRSSYASSNQYNFVRTDAKNHREISEDFEQKAQNRKDVNEVAKEKEGTVLKGTSKIPILLSTRERSKISSQNREKSVNLEYVNFNSRKQTKDVLDSNRNQINSQRESIIGPYAAIYQWRKRFQQEESQTSNQTFNSHRHSSRPSSYTSEIINRDYNNIAGSGEAIYSDDNSNSIFVDTDKFMDKNEKLDCTRGHQRSLSRNMQQQTLVETSVYERQRKLTDRNAYRPLRTAPNLLPRVYQKSQHLQPQISIDDDTNIIYRLKDRKIKNTTTMELMIKMDLMSSCPQENVHSEISANPYRRRLRSLSPSQLRRSRQCIKLVSNRFHAASMYDIDKAVKEEDYNVRNKRHFSPEAKSHRVQNAKEESRYREFLRSFSISERPHNNHSNSSSSSSSNISRSDQPAQDENQDVTLNQDYNGNDNSESSSPRNQIAQAFDIIAQQTTNRQSIPHDDVDSFFTPLNIDKAEYSIETTNAASVDETSKEWSSEDDAKPTSRIGSRHLNHEELISVDHNCNKNTDSNSDIPEQPDDRSSAKKRSIVISNERILPYEDPKISKESVSLYQTPNHNAHHSPISNSPCKRNSRCNSRNLIQDPKDVSEEITVASISSDETASVKPLDSVGHPPIDSMTGDSPAIIIASRPHSHEIIQYEKPRSIESANSRNKIGNQESIEEQSSINDILDDRQSKDSASETNTEPGILKIETESIESHRRIPSKLPIRGIGRHHVFSNKRTAEKPSEKSKRTVQQCFAQLENKDWEITMKGLKSLSQISKHHPEYLDVCTTGTIGRLLGRHIKNLRSQVARTACLAAGDVFSSQIRGIDQDLDDIAGPLLHRTADTNRFLRADSNAALDQMVQHLPPHKIISIIVLRGASHQNAIVRAATARLLSDITDRIGPDHIMILPRDVKDKLLNTGAKLLMDGNLDARNHAKRMFRRLTRCEGFRKALMDAVPDTTLRHIDKTMKTL